MAIIQPEEVTGLQELFAEVKALRRELDLLQGGPRTEIAREPRVADVNASVSAKPAGRDDDTLEPMSMSPEDIRDRVGEVVGERSKEPKPVATTAAAPQEP